VLNSVEIDDRDQIKNRLGAFIHHPLCSLVIAILIVVSVSLVMVHLTLPEGHAAQGPVEFAQWVITIIFVIELSLKCYVAPSRSRFFGQYWVDIIATLPWTQSLRVLRVLRLLRMFRVAVILSRRVRFVSAIFRSAVGEYVVLAMVMLTLLGVGTFALYVSESRARLNARAAELNLVQRDLREVERQVRLQPRDHHAAVPHVPTRDELLQRIEAVSAQLERNQKIAEPQRHALERDLRRLERRLPPTTDDQHLGTMENSFWATIFFLVATEPMIDVPRTNVGRAIVLAVMFGGLTTFAIFTGIVTALMVNRLKRRMEIDDMDRFTLVDHVVICGWNRLVPLIIGEVTNAPGMSETAVVVVADLEDPPDEIDSGRTGLVYFVRGDYTKPDVLKQARVPYAARAIIVADTTIPQRSDQDRDARTVLSALMIERMKPDIYTCAELLNPDNEAHLRAAGIEEVVVTSEVGGHHLAMAALHFGLAEVLNEMMTGRFGDTLRKRPVPADYAGLGFLEVVERCKREQDSMVIGIEVKGQDGTGSEGYAMRLNPEPDMRVGERDNLVLIGSPTT
jgi:voltage-gated potassium channel Kch